MILTGLHKPFGYLLGKNINKKVIIFESDDWGSIRIPNIRVRDILFKKFPKMRNDPYSCFDTLESGDDLTALYDVLSKYKDYKENNPLITVNTIIGNPKFSSIEDSNFRDYHYERFDRTIATYYGEVVNKIWLDGIKNRLFFPQLHGREHLHSLQWLKELQEDNEELKFAFQYKTYAIPFQSRNGYKRGNLLSALNISGLNNEKDYHSKYLIESNKLFTDYYGFQSKSFIATTYIWNEEHEMILNELGIKAFQGIRYQYMPVNNKKYKRVFHYTGQKNKHSQYYFVRNAFFEPSINPNKDWVSECLKRIKLAFVFNKPAIIGTHRLNFIGTIEEKNRKNNLILFDSLLSEIIKKWPDVEFSSTNELILRYNTLNNINCSY